MGEADAAGGGPSGDAQGLMQMIMARPGLMNLLVRNEGDGRKVRVATLKELETAVSSSSALQWDERMALLAGCEGTVLQDDTDGTSKVRFPTKGIEAWLPTESLETL